MTVRATVERIRVRAGLPRFVCAMVLLGLGCDRQLSFDAQGNAHGSGERTYAYASGATKLREEYVKGKLVHSRWYRPDGTLVQETRWADGTGEGIYLREDGSVRSRLRYVHGVADGEAKEYDGAGNVTKIMQYRGGARVSERGPVEGSPGGS